MEEKKLEIVPAIQSCEEILSLFRDSSYVFKSSPVITAPFLVIFSGIFMTVAELSLALIPSYREHLQLEIYSLMEAINEYHDLCVKSVAQDHFGKPKESILELASGSTKSLLVSL